MFLCEDCHKGCTCFAIGLSRGSCEGCKKTSGCVDCCAHHKPKSNDIHEKVAEAMRVAGERDTSFAGERERESELVEALVQDVLPVLPALCSRHEAMQGRVVFRGLQVGMYLYLDERGRFRMYGVPGVEQLVEPRDLVAKYGRGAARLVSHALTNALNSLIAGNSQDRTNEAKRLAEKYRAVSALLRNK